MTINLMFATLTISALFNANMFAEDAQQTPLTTSSYLSKIGKAGDTADIIISGISAEDDEILRTLATSSAKVGVGMVVDAAAVPATVMVTSTVGTTAATGTAIGTLSGAAATSASMAAVGAPAAAALGTVGIVLAPATVGAAIVVGAAAGVTYGINWLFFK